MPLCKQAIPSTRLRLYPSTIGRTSTTAFSLRPVVVMRNELRNI